MNWGYFRIFAIVGFLALVIQLLVFVWENWFNTTWQGLVVPVTLRQVLTGVGHLHAALYRGVDAPARSAASYLFDLLSP